MVPRNKQIPRIFRVAFSPISVGTKLRIITTYIFYFSQGKIWKGGRGGEGGCAYYHAWT